jgi:glutamate-ammonia-ligase adenylyltransferase
MGAGSWLTDALMESADSDRALVNVDRWVGVGEEALQRVDALSSNPALAIRLSRICGASQPLADALAKNPELGNILGDPDELSRLVSIEQIIAEGTALIKGTNSFIHALDRLRYLKQRTLLRIVWNDLGAIWEPEVVWTSLSALADGILRIATDLVWEDLKHERQDIAVIALGKHGSNEVNYSSDLDLLFVSDNGCDASISEKFCAKLIRAIEGKMGRGELYRIDLRLRPMGKAGPVCLGISATRKYYESYCEPWEIQALVRARACAGELRLANELLRDLSTIIYRGPRSDIFLESLVEAKHRYEQEIAQRGEASTNIKLGPGGIRDIEFIVQLFQLTVGDTQPSLQGAGVYAAIDVLQDLGLLGTKHAGLLRSSYGFLRQTEHRIQLRQDLQRHTLPSDIKERQVLSRLMGFSSWSGFEAELRRRRSLVRSYLEALVPALNRLDTEERSVAAALRLDASDPAASYAARLFAASDSPKALGAEVIEDPETAERVRMIASRAPRVISDLAFHRSLWDIAFGEEVEYTQEDDRDPSTALIGQLERNHDWRDILEVALKREAVTAALKDAYHGDPVRTSAYLTSVAETALIQTLDKIGGHDIDIIALGRLGSKELQLGSDWDVMLFAPSQETQPRAERMAQEWLRTARAIGLASGFFPVDVRLRPEGGAGLMVRSPAGFSTYASTVMEPWERLALTRARSLRRRMESEDCLREAWTTPELTWEQESEILRMRKRVQTERMRTWEATRDIKLGIGTQLDIEWLAGLLRLRHPSAVTEVHSTHKLVMEFAEVGALSHVQAATLRDAALLFGKLRNAMFLLDFDSDSVLPENPEKLGRLSVHVQIGTGNDLLAKVGQTRGAVTEVFNEVIGAE